MSRPPDPPGDLRWADFTAVPLAAVCFGLGAGCLVFGLLGFLFGVFELRGTRNILFAGALLAATASLLYRRAQRRTPPQ